MTPSTSSGLGERVEAKLAHMTTDQLREEIARAEEMAALADYIDDTRRSQTERRRWLAVALAIRVEVARREEGWSGVWPEKAR